MLCGPLRFVVAAIMTFVSVLFHLAQIQILTNTIANLILFLHSTILDSSKLISVAARDENMRMELIFHITDYNELFHQTVLMKVLWIK